MIGNAPLPARYWRCGCARVLPARRVFRHPNARLLASRTDALLHHEMWRARRAANPAAADLGTVGAS